MRNITNEKHRRANTTGADKKAAHKPDVCEPKHRLNTKQLCHFAVEACKYLKGEGEAGKPEKEVNETRDKRAQIDAYTSKRTGIGAPSSIEDNLIIWNRVRSEGFLHELG